MTSEFFPLLLKIRDFRKINCNRLGPFIILIPPIVPNNVAGVDWCTDGADGAVHVVVCVQQSCAGPAVLLSDRAETRHGDTRRETSVGHGVMLGTGW